MLKYKDRNVHVVTTQLKGHPNYDCTVSTTDTYLYICFQHNVTDVLFSWFCLGAKIKRCSLNNY